MAEYPKRLTEVFQTKDGSIFGDEVSALRHERRASVKAAIDAARTIWSAHIDSRRLRGLGGAAPRMDFDELIMQELETAGII